MGPTCMQSLSKNCTSAFVRGVKILVRNLNHFHTSFAYEHEGKQLWYAWLIHLWIIYVCKLLQTNKPRRKETEWEWEWGWGWSVGVGISREMLLVSSLTHRIRLSTTFCSALIHLRFLFWELEHSFLSHHLLLLVLSRNYCYPCPQSCIPSSWQLSIYYHTATGPLHFSICQRCHLHKRVSIRWGKYYNSEFR